MEATRQPTSVTSCTIQNGTGARLLPTRTRRAPQLRGDAPSASSYAGALRPGGHCAPQALSARGAAPITRPLVAASGVGGAAVVPNALLAAKSLFAALNRRDVSAVLSLLAEDVSYDNLSAAASLRGRSAVGRFYLEALAAVPEEALFVLEPEAPEVEEAAAAASSSGGGHSNGWGEAEGPVLQAGVAWHLELNGVVVPLSRGVGVYWADPSTGRLTRIWDNPEPAFKLTQPVLTSAAWASPLLRGLGPLVAPAARGVTSLLNTLSPGSSGGDGEAAATAPSGGGPSSMASSVMSTLGSMLPFQSSPSSSSSSSQGSGGGGGGQEYRDRTSRTAEAGGAARGSEAGGPLGLQSWTRPAAVGAAAAVVSSPAVATAAQPPPPPPQAPSAPTTAAAVATTVVANTKGESIRMRALASPNPATTTSSPSPHRSLTSSYNSGSDSDEEAPAPAAFAAAITTALSTSRTSPAPSRSVSRSTSPGPSPGPSRPGSPSRSARAAASRPLLSNAQSSFASSDDNGDAAAGSSVDAAAADNSHLPFPPNTSPVVNLTSLWEKDAAASQVEEYEAMLDVLELGGLQKVTARLIDGLDLVQGEDKFEVSFVTIVPFFRVTEKSRFGGPTDMMRRDLRGGQQKSVAVRVPGGVTVTMSWGSPLAGSLTEEYVISADGARLGVTSSMRIGTRFAKATQVYNRSARNKSDFLASQRSSYGSMEDVLKNQEKQYGKK